MNEGLVEWPPSPWRLVRALIACGYSTQHWDEVPPEGRRLVEALSSVLPEYRLPQAALGHARHYMPTTKMKDGSEETTLVLDTFADVGDGALWVRWPTTVDAEAQRLFHILVAHLGYLGRSESWVLGESLSDDVPLPEAGRAVPHSGAILPERSYEQVVLSAPEVPHDYAKWRKREVEDATRELALPTGKKPTGAQKKSIEAIHNAYPDDIVDCLQRDTAWWKERRWSKAPGSRSVLYWRANNSIEVGPPSPARSSTEHRVEMMLLALSTPSGSMSALPTILRTLPQADLLHKALVAKLGFHGEPCPEIVGRDGAGEPLKGHKHSHILPVDLDGDGRLDHIVVWAPMGLGTHAQRAVRSLRRTYMKGGVGELQVAVAGVGTLNDLRAIGFGISRGISDLLGPPNGAVSWVTETPFVPPRHLKKKGRSSLVGQIESELDARGFPRAEVSILDWTGPRIALRHFVRRRLRGSPPPIDAGFAVRLLFDRPVIGPVCLGYGSHFGIGRFSAD